MCSTQHVYKARLLLLKYEIATKPETIDQTHTHIKREQQEHSQYKAQDERTKKHGMRKREIEKRNTLNRKYGGHTLRLVIGNH